MNYMSREDLFAYLDWCALRPITELEFEKSCRGPLVPVEDAYAWGDASLAQGYYTVAAYIQGDETISSGYSTTAGNAVCTVTLDLNGGSGPLRTGIFAGHPLNTSRRSSGASYYGAMELSGNASEVSIAVSNADSRAYDGSHGDGSLDPGGLYTDPAWPESSLARGGSLGSSSTVPLTVSHRPLALSGGRGYMTGGRGVRTAP
ncbi:MAG: hypothetical protein IPG69_18805 [Flavobacteriales bacterium]|nr:hypothetical protein [Flavobacteriales bacterium]